jgi:hypothetical protein
LAKEGGGEMIGHKFRARPVDIDGFHFPSTKEGRYYQELKLKQKAGIVAFFLRQVPIFLPGGVKFVIDFVEFHADGTVRFVDVKGMRTRQYIDKKKVVEAMYPITVEEA